MMITRRIAYFSMEIALNPDMRTYSGGLGVLAGDTIRSAADLSLPMVGVTLVHRKGYFRQRLDERGSQIEGPDEWDLPTFLKERPERVSVTLEGRDVHLRAWEYVIDSPLGSVVPVYLLDADLPENAELDRGLTDYLYGGDARYRLCQEIILGIGGVRMLRAIGHDGIRRFHLNEGHSSLLALELLDEEARKGGRNHFSIEDVDRVRRYCVFTTHTPVPAGHDRFPPDLVENVLRRPDLYSMEKIFFHEGSLNMTYIALNLSRYVNGVAKRHGEISRLQYAPYEIDSITNGVHVPTWVTSPFAKLFDRYIPDWQNDNFSLRYAAAIPDEAIWSAHLEAKNGLIGYVNEKTGSGMNTTALTIGFARRATPYKRADLILQDIKRLKAMAAEVGPLQLIWAGKAHPKDEMGKDIIRRVLAASGELGEGVRLVYLENYDMRIAARITAGVDVWLNTPEPPLEASGTSGMKSALNGVPTLSILDGWWIEGCLEGVTGWAIGTLDGKPVHYRPDGGKDAALLYDKLETVVAPLFYRDRDRFISVMRNAIALNGSFFNTQRMLKQYVVRAYL
jgi:starch phosphorylase